MDRYAWWWTGDDDSEKWTAEWGFTGRSNGWIVLRKFGPYCLGDAIRKTYTPTVSETFDIEDVDDTRWARALLEKLIEFREWITPKTAKEEIELQYTFLVEAVYSDLVQEHEQQVAAIEFVERYFAQ